jgi:RNA polymerase sigma-70 factor (ECF subfamily)
MPAAISTALGIPRAPSGAGLALPEFQRVYAEYAPFMWRSLRRLGVREPDLADACQEAFLVVHRKLSEFDGRSTLRTWLFGICLRLASNWRRRIYARPEIATDSVPDSAELPIQGEAMQRRQARVLLDGILDQLDEEKRAVFVLYELENWPMNEVAAAAECPLQTAYSRLHAARRQVEAGISRLQRQWSVA